MSDPVEAIQATLAKFPRMHGYYLLKLVDIEWTDDEEASLDVIMQQLDDRPWPPREQRPTFPCWTDHVITEEDAREMVITGLAGGANVGHTRDTISRPAATAIWDQFRSLFSERVRFFRNDGFGDERYVYAIEHVIGAGRTQPMRRCQSRIAKHGHSRSDRGGDPLRTRSAGGQKTA